MVETGAYSSASEVVNEALRLLFETKELGAHALERLNKDIQVGIGQADRGEVIDGEDSRRRVMIRLAGKHP